MSFAGEHRCICMVSSLDLFTRPMMQTSVEATRMQHFRPLSSVEGANLIEFRVPPSEDYIDLANTLLELKAKVVKVKEGVESDLTDAEAQRVAVEKLLLHSLFTQVDLTVGEKVVSSGLNTYPYVAYLQTLLSYGSDASKSFLSAEGWVGGAPASNKIDGTRSTLVKGDMHFLGRLHLDLFQQNKFILPHVDLKLRLLKAPDAFCLMHVPATAIEQLDVKVKVLDCFLLVQKVTVNPDVTLAHEKALLKGPACYPLRRSVVRLFPLSASSLTAVVDNVTGEIPNLLLVGLVPSQACNGRLHLSPFAFSHQHVTRFACYVDGVPCPVHPFKPKFESNSYVQSYLSLFRATGNHLSNDGVPQISYRQYVDDDCVVWGINLSLDNTFGGTHINPVRHGTLRLEFTFKTPLVEAITAVCYLEYDNELCISETREVSIDW